MYPAAAPPVPSAAFSPATAYYGYPTPASSLYPPASSIDPMMMVQPQAPPSLMAPPPPPPQPAYLDNAPPASMVPYTPAGPLQPAPPLPPGAMPPPPPPPFLPQLIPGGPPMSCWQECMACLAVTLCCCFLYDKYEHYHDQDYIP